MLDNLYQLPIETLAVLTAVVFVGTYWIGCVLVRPILRVFVRSRGIENSIVGTVLSAFGVFYGLLLSLIAVAAFQNLSEVATNAENEASDLIALYRTVAFLPAAQSEPIQQELREYCRFIIDEEWPTQRKGEIPRGAVTKIDAIWQGLHNIEPQSRRDELIQAEALEYLKSLLENGRHRRYAAEMGIPSVMWYVVIVGTVINFALMWLFDMRFLSQLFLGGLLAFFLGPLILLIAVLDRPYRSTEFGVSPKAYEMVYSTMMHNAADNSPTSSDRETPSDG